MKAVDWIGSEERPSNLHESEAAQGGFWLLLLWCLIGLTAGLLAALTRPDAGLVDPTMIEWAKSAQAIWPQSLA